MSSTIRWYWKSNSKVQATDENEEWTEYSDVESKAIEEAFCSHRNNTESVEFDHYWINFNNFTQINKHNENKQTSIKRIPGKRNDNRAPLE